jgi:hypothetical protein
LDRFKYCLEPTYLITSYGDCHFKFWNCTQALYTLPITPWELASPEASDQVEMQK